MINRDIFFNNSYETQLGIISFQEDLIIDTMLGLDSRWICDEHTNSKKIQLMGFSLIGLNKNRICSKIAIDYIYCDTYQEALDKLEKNKQGCKRTHICIENYLIQKFINRKSKIKNFLENVLS